MNKLRCYFYWHINRQMKYIEQFRFIDWNGISFWMRQGFGFCFILKLKKLKKWDFEIWNFRNLYFGLIKFIIFGWGGEKLEDEIYLLFEFYFCLWNSEIWKIETGCF